MRRACKIMIFLQKYKKLKMLKMLLENIHSMIMDMNIGPCFLYPPGTPCFEFPQHQRTFYSQKKNISLIRKYYMNVNT